MVKTVVIKTEENFNLYDKKVMGLYPIERNIKLFWHYGVSNFVLDFSTEEDSFFRKKLLKKLSKLKNINITFNSSNINIDESVLVVNSNDYIEYSLLAEFNKNFTLTNGHYVPQYKNILKLHNLSSFKEAVKLGTEKIRKSSGGYISQNINKRISIPISLFLVKFRISPNLITFINLIVGWSAAYFIFTNNHINIAIGGFLFQFASIFDGCDGEVAKMSFKFSKFGGIFDTFNDYSTLLLTAISMFYIYVTRYGNDGIYYLLPAFVFFALMIITLIIFIFPRSESRSFASFERDFLHVLKPVSKSASIISKAVYVTKKEFYSYLVMIFAFFNIVELLFPLYTVILGIGYFIVLYFIFFSFRKNKEYWETAGHERTQFISSRQ